MKTVLGTTALVLMLATAPAAFAESQCPTDAAGQLIDQLPEKCRAELDTWSMSQPDASVDFKGEVAIGTILPDTVMFTDVPTYKPYGYVVVNKKRMLVDRNTRAVIKIY